MRFLSAPIVPSGFQFRRVAADKGAIRSWRDQQDVRQWNVADATRARNALLNGECDAVQKLRL
jgi:hypothetical protein